MLHKMYIFSLTHIGFIISEETTLYALYLYLIKYSVQYYLRLKTVKHLHNTIKLRTFALSKDKTLFNNIKTLWCIG